MTAQISDSVIPAKAGTHLDVRDEATWAPAFAGVTGSEENEATP
jgi:hypothetical protein